MDYQFVYEAVIEPGEDSGYVAWFPDLPEAFTQGTTLQEVSLRAIETLALALADYVEDGTEPPVASFGHDHANDSSLLLVSTTLTDEDIRNMGAVSSTEAAHMLGLSKGRVAQLVARGQLESVGEGTSRLISLRSIHERRNAPRRVGRPSKVLQKAT
jgi:predicted RNase H-like HicB family nuclease